MDNDLKKQLYASFPKMRRSKRILPTVLICVAAFVLMVVAQYISDSKTPEQFDPANTGQTYATVEAWFMTEAFASRGDEDYYFIMDGEGNDRVVMLTRSLNKEERDLKDYTYMELDSAAPVTFTGVPQKMETQLRDMLVESFNDFWITDMANESNIEDLVGVMYLKADTEPVDESPLFGIALVIFFFGLLFLVIFIIIAVSASITTGRQLKNLDEVAVYNIQKEMAGAKMINKKKIVLLDSYFIAENNGLHIYKYTDVIWMYNHIQRLNFVPYYKSLMMGLSNGKVRSIITGSAIGKAGEQIDDVIRAIYAHNPQIMVGYSRENIQAFKNYKKGSFR